MSYHKLGIGHNDLLAVADDVGHVLLGLNKRPIDPGKMDHTTR